VGVGTSERLPTDSANLTDGESTDGDPASIGKEILSLSTNDGATLVLNCHVSSMLPQKWSIPPKHQVFPMILRGRFSIFLVACPKASGKLPNKSGESPRGFEGFVFNGDPTSVVQFFEIGTRPANLR